MFTVFLEVLGMLCIGISFPHGEWITGMGIRSSAKSVSVLFSTCPESMSDGINGITSMSDSSRTAVAADALSALASEPRIKILRVLAESDEPLTFSDLREAIDMYDSGQFNYHLTELCGRFVRNTDRGYILGHAGERVVLAAAGLDSEGATALAEQARTDSDECPVCGEEDCNRMIHVHLSGI